ncbi:MAG: nuclear transport factor 2 family protein [Lentimicrobium sp.]|nr:nuclear transport factor 2 family protein [Lentimicrobium sp.]
MNLLKEEVRTVELDFARMAADSGIETAFLNFAAPGAVLKRGNNLVIGFDSISAYLEENKQPGERLSWSPDFIEVAASGDLAYTYGKFVYLFPDSAGLIQKQEGYFHTVWKRQPDGKWKFVWD